MHWVQCHKPEQSSLPRVRFLMNDSRRFNTLLRKCPVLQPHISGDWISFFLSVFSFFLWLDFVDMFPFDDWILSWRLPLMTGSCLAVSILMTGSYLAVSLLMTGSYFDVFFRWSDLVLPSPFWWLDLILTSPFDDWILSCLPFDGLELILTSSSDDWILSCRLPLMTGSYGDVSWWLDLFLPSPFWWMSLVLTSPFWWMDLVWTSPF